MGVLWARDEPVTATQVQQELGDGLAYNTVQTILTRLYDKHLVQRRRMGRGHAYWPVEDGAAAAASRMREVLAGRGDRQAVLQQFAAALDESDVAALRAVLSDAQRSAGT